jgi:ABC-type multidrug transport system permease subunit
MEFLVTAVQVTVSSMITYFCVSFQGSFGTFYGVIYQLAMTSTALGVLLGSSEEDPNTAMELLPGTIMPQILFSGFFVPPNLMPSWLAWVCYLCPLTYTVCIAFVNEFDGW